MSRSSFWLCGALAMAAVGVSAASSQDQDSFGLIDVDHAAEQSLRRGQQHRYELRLVAGECATVVVEQHGIDVVVAVRAADERVLATVDDESRSQGLEQVDVVAAIAGTYSITIVPAPGVPRPGSYVVRLASRRIASDADRDLQEARKLRAAALRLSEADHQNEARPLLERALTLTAGARGPDDEQVGRVTSELASVSLELRDFARAESLYRRALGIMDETLGPEHPTTAFTASRLATLYQLSGERPKAEVLLRPALERIEKALGAEHLWFVRCLSTLAGLSNDARDFDQAEAILHRQMTILERLDYTDSVLYAKALNNLGDIYGRKHDYTQAQALLQRSISIDEKLRGPDDLFLSNPLTNLGIIAREQKDYGTAEAYYRRALSIRERLLGPDHPELFVLLNNLANIYHARGDYARSLEAHLHALRVGGHAFGPYHPNTLLSLGNIARASAAAGDMPTAIAFQRRADGAIERQLALNLAVGSERQKLVFVRSMAERTDRTISLHLREVPDNPDAAALAALVLLQRKGRVLDALIDTAAAVRQRIGNADDQILLDRLSATTAELARIALNPPADGHPEERAAALKGLEAQKERLEAELAEHSAEFRAQVQPVTLEGVQAALPDDAALVEFAIFRPFDPRAERNGDSYGPPHYAAYVVRRDAPPRGMDLGAAATIDVEIDALRQALRDPARLDVKERAQAMGQQVFRPLLSALAGATRLLIAPDGALNLVPFEALVDERGAYLIERYSISYLTSGRDLLRMQGPRADAGPAVIFADPVFGEPLAAAGQAVRRRVGAPGTRRGIAASEDLASVYFPPLAGTADEALAIKTLFPDSAMFTGRRATKAALEQVKAPRMLHIASHGFFLQDARADTENPLLRSGLALAGANLAAQGRDGGILTALEASGLDLWGTKLVTLSACDTGMGEVRNGEGVYGLRRAFVLAGSETVVMSLWSVSDSVARETMVAYYKGLREGLGRGDSLREAKLAMLARNGRSHPFYWAAFVQSGEWARLDGTR